MQRSKIDVWVGLFVVLGGAAILFLAGDSASMITGHTLPVDGGWVAR